jgi:hypothetical protein
MKDTTRRKAAESPRLFYTDRAMERMGYEATAAEAMYRRGCIDREAITLSRDRFCEMHKTPEGMRYMDERWEEIARLHDAEYA